VTDDELRALVREAVERHLGASPAVTGSSESSGAIGREADPHPSHAVYVTVVNDGDACVIEPGVPCSHCNYCRSHGY